MNETEESRRDFLKLYNLPESRLDAVKFQEETYLQALLCRGDRGLYVQVVPKIGEQEPEVNAFYRHLRLLIEGADRNQPVQLAIAVTDINNLIEIVLNALGFELIKTVGHRGAIKIYAHDSRIRVRRYEKVFDRESTAKELTEALHDAITLYLHEDNLNWTKFGMLVSFTFAFMAAFFFVLQNESSTVGMVLNTLLLGFAMVINYIFDHKIKSGLYYMNSHKEKIKKIERMLKYFQPNFVMMIEAYDQRVAGRSKTAKLMEMMPLLGYLIWPACYTLAILHYVA
jgi:hypothetical protein